MNHTPLLLHASQLCRSMLIHHNAAHYALQAACATAHALPVNAQNKQATPTAIPLATTRKQNLRFPHRKSRLAGHTSPPRPSCLAAATMHCDAQTAAFTLA
jgi:hypothetical protein